MSDSQKGYDSNRTKCCGWVFLGCTLFFDIMLIVGHPVTMHLLPGDHSLFNFIAICWDFDEISRISVWYGILRIAGYLSLAALVLKIPVCVAAIWKAKELPLLLLLAASTFSSGVLVCHAVALNGFPNWIQGDVIMIVFHIIGNAVLFVVLLRQMMAKNREKRGKKEHINV